MKVIRTKIGGRRGFHSLTLQYLGFTIDLKNDERLVLDLSNNENAYQDDLNNKNTWGQWFVHDDWNEEDVIRDVGGIHYGSFIGGWIHESSRVQYYNLMKKHLVVRDHILKKIDDFKSKYFDGNKILGIHIRGNEIFHDNTRPKLSFNYYKHKIDLYLDKGNYNKVFVCSDQIHTINKLKDIYGEKMIVYPTLTYSPNGSHDYVYQKSLPNEGYIRGEDILIESILLTKTDFLLRTLSGITLYSTIYNPELDYCDIDSPFYSIKDYISQPHPSILRTCKYEDNFDIYYKEIKKFEETLPSIEAHNRVNFIQSYL